MKEYSIGILGSTGLVGRNIVNLLEKSKIKIKELRLFASNKSKDKVIRFRNKDIIVQEIKEGSFKSLDFCLCALNSELSKIYIPLVLKEGVRVIDNSKAFRNDKDVPLIIPEVNINILTKNNRLIANPNCSTIESVICLKPLHDLFILKKVNYSTYQSVSGSGKKGLEEYENVFNNKAHSLYPYNIRETIICEIDGYGKEEYSNEELKMINETKKILNLDNLNVNATCVRVPILYSHGVSVDCEFEKEFDKDKFLAELKKYPSIVVMDSLKEHIYPNGIISKGSEFVYIGRIRKNLFNNKQMSFFVMSDNLLIGASLNLIKILKSIIKQEEMNFI